MKTIHVEAAPQRRLALTDAPEPERGENGVRVAVRAISLNRGEVRTAYDTTPAGARPGTDFAGVVEEAPEGGAFRAGDRVVGILPMGAWSERVVTAPYALVKLPDSVSFEQAAALPVAGLTAKLALEKCAKLSGGKALITGATGGVGMIAVQLAANAGAEVTALVRSDVHRARLMQLGAHKVATSPEDAAGRYDIVLELVGGASLGQSLGWLASRGVCVLAGNAAGAATTFDSDRFRHGDGAGLFGGTTLYGFFLGEELTHAPPGPPLAALVADVAAGWLDPVIGVTDSWENVDAVARALLERGFTGKAVLTL